MSKRVRERERQEVAYDRLIGTQSLSLGLGALLKTGTIHLSTPVSKITDVASLITVTTSTGVTYQSKKLILSIPTPLYKDITFSPPLSGPKLVFSSSTKLGYYSKLILCYSSPWWTSQSCGLAISYLTPAAVIRDTSVPIDGQYSLTLRGLNYLNTNAEPMHSHK
jgi:monoamine oxidase